MVVNMVLCIKGGTNQRIFENRIQAELDENGDWRRLQNEELHSLYGSPHVVRVIKSRRLRWVGPVARVEEARSTFKILTGTPSGKRPLGRPNRRLEDNITMDHKETIPMRGIELMRLKIGIIGEPL